MMKIFCFTALSVLFVLPILTNAGEMYEMDEFLAATTSGNGGGGPQQNVPTNHPTPTLPFDTPDRDNGRGGGNFNQGNDGYDRYASYGFSTGTTSNPYYTSYVMDQRSNQSSSESRKVRLESNLIVRSATSSEATITVYVPLATIENQGMAAATNLFSGSRRSARRKINAGNKVRTNKQQGRRRRRSRILSGLKKSLRRPSKYHRRVYFCLETTWSHTVSIAKVRRSIQLNVARNSQVVRVSPVYLHDGNTDAHSLKEQNIIITVMA